MNSTDRRPMFEEERCASRRLATLVLVVALVGLASVMYAITAVDKDAESVSNKERSKPMTLSNPAMTEGIEKQGLPAASNSPTETATFALG